jgi:hypothetical protein
LTHANISGLETRAYKETPEFWKTMTTGRIEMITSTSENVSEKKKLGHVQYPG